MLRYRMPVHFGPQPSPRQYLDGRRPDPTRFPVRHTARVSYLARAEQLVAYLPPGFSLWDDPVVTIDVCYQQQVEWLAGRDYALFGVSVPVFYTGKTETVHGDFRLAVWESHSDVVTSGREDIGSNKLFAEIPEPRVLGDRYIYSASSMGCRFFEFELHGVREAPIPPAHVPSGDGPRNEGMLWYKYIPRTGNPDAADAAYAVVWPHADSRITVDKYFTAAKSMVRFARVMWEDLPFMHHVVNAIAGLDLVEFRGASLTLSHGGSDFSGSRIIK